MLMVRPTHAMTLPQSSMTQCTGRGTAGRVAIREEYIRSAYADADEKLGITRSSWAATRQPSPHQITALHAVVRGQRNALNGGSVDGISLHASNAAPYHAAPPPVLSGLAANTYVSGDLTKACWAGGRSQIYINTTLPTGTTYAEVRAAVRTAFQNVTDLANLGKQVIQTIMNKEDLRNVDGSDSLHPNRSGDVVVVTRPPYQSDAGTANQVIALLHFFGQHGYLPDYVDLPNNINMHATFVASGPGIRRQSPVAGVRAVDIAPTLAFLMNIPGPQNARGKILYNLTPTPGQYKEITILDISDYHGQLVPLTEAADTLGPAFTIGGSAFLKPWFDLYRSEAPNGSLTVAAGDSVGATPPISSFFGDTPTIELMNAMGFSADGLGNHNFDKGSAYLRNTLIPLAQYPFLSANVVDTNGNTPAEWKPSQVYDTTFGGVKVGIVGFTNDDAPTLVSPTAFDPFHVANSLAAVNAGR
jgi:hypothetical protein